MNSNPVYLRRREAYLLFFAAIVIALVIAPIGAWLIGPRAPSEKAGPVNLVQVPAAVSPASGPRSYREAVEKAAPSVVNVYTAKRLPPRRYDNPLFRYYFGDQPEKTATALGSGVIVSDKGYILTNSHVVEGADEIAIAFADGRLAEARVVGSDPETDLAVLRIQSEGLRPIAFGDSTKLHVGDVVFAIGDPYGVGQTVTHGIVSATGRNRLGINTFENFIQTDAAINPGNSGGALVDADGNLVGVNSAIFSESGASAGIGFAIPVSLATQVMKEIIEKGQVIRGWLGIEARDVSAAAKDARGAVVAGVQPGGPAARGGLRAGDIVVAINGKPIADAAALMTEAAALAPGSRGEIQVRRDGKDTMVSVEVGRRPPMRREQ